jgi:hypothetical protein
MALKLAQGALLEMTRYGWRRVAATINQGTRLCSLADTQKLSITFQKLRHFPFFMEGSSRQTQTIDYAKKTFMITMR